MKKPSFWNRSEEDWFRGSNGLQPRPASQRELVTIWISMILIAASLLILWI